MANTEFIVQKPPLGVGNIIRNALRLYFQNFIPFFLITLIPTLGLAGILSGIGLLSGGPGNVVDGGPIEIASPAFVVGVSLVTMVISGIAVNFVTGLITLASFDAWQGRPMTYARYFSVTLQSIVPLSVLTVVAALAAAIGFVFLFVPGVYIYAMFFVLAPSVLVERTGFGGLSRSRELTREYRWPIVGMLIVLILALYAIVIPLGVVAGRVAPLMSPEMLYWSGMGMEMISNTIGYGIAAVFIAMTYARLREIKEGLGVEDLSKVFA